MSQRKPAKARVPRNQDLVRSLHGSAIYFVLREPLRRDQFDQACALLEGRAESQGGADRDSHWEHLQQRLTGAQPPWDMLAPRFDGPLRTYEDGVRLRAGWHTVANIVERRGYRSYRIDRIDCTLDFFNPGNELRVTYGAAGEPVVALVLTGNVETGSTNRDLRRELSGADALFELLRWLDRILQPEHIVGSDSLASVLLAYREGRIDPDIRPWEFYYPLMVLPMVESLSLARLQGELPLVVPGVKLLPRTFRLGRVDGWSDGRVLVLATPGFTAAIGNELAAAAALFGKVHFQLPVFPVFTFHRGPEGQIMAHRHRSRMDRTPQPDR